MICASRCKRRSCSPACSTMHPHSPNSGAPPATLPALMVLFVRGRIIPERRNPLNRFLIAVYRPIIRVVLGAKTLSILLALAMLAVSVWPMTRLGTEFMPNLNEGTLLYMPTTLPGLSVTKSAELLQMQDRIIRSFPEVEPVYGTAG